MVRASIVVLAASFLFGCSSSADLLGEPLDGDQGAGDAGTSGTTSTPPTCSDAPPPAPMDPSTLPACCNGEGAAHCVPTNEVPSSTAAQLSTCPNNGGVCVPDPFIKNPSLVPPSCKSLNNADGVCLSVCVTQVHQYRDLLPQASCAPDERCAPCISPLDMKPTGACDIGKTVNPATGGPMCTPAPQGPDHSDAGSTPPAPAACPHVGPPVIDPSTLPSCDPNGGAHCLNASLVPPAMAGQLAACPTGLCVPDVFIAAGGNFIPPTCTSVASAEGRCLHEAIPQVASQKALLPQASCQSYERCVPCYDPQTGKSTGACNLSCDPGPKEPPKTFAACCTPKHANAPQGKCVPTTLVPTTEQKNLDTYECSQGAELCVPAEMLATPFTPNACTGSTLLTGDYTGVCLSDCLKFSFFQNLGIVQGSCDDIHKCVPCKDPLTGKATGAPGCPP